jgi:hypothetical protein
LLEQINNIEYVLLGLFNVGIVARIIKTIIDGMQDENFPTKKYIKNYIKIIIVVNTISAFVIVISNYFTR